MQPEEYPIPAGPVRRSDEVRRSRFITTLAHAPTREAAESFIGSVRAEFPDATHNCWAFVAGPPGSMASVGLSDDGEPHGTAGRPMLEALLHSGVGEVAAVVTRYFGGVKLGRGGLGRAYSGGVVRALAELPRRQRVRRTLVRLVVEYGALDAIRRLATERAAEIQGEEYGVDVRLLVAVPQRALEGFEGAVAGVTAGRAVIERVAE